MRKTRIEQYYDRCASEYDVKHGVAGFGNRHNFSRYYEPFLARAIAPGSRVLELGCGTGVYTRWLMDRGCSVVGMDISEKMLAAARKRCPRATFVRGNCECPASHLPGDVSAKRFDVILGVNTFSYYPNKAAALRQYGALLVKGGRVVLLDMNGRCPLYRVMVWLNKNEIREWYDQVRESNDAQLSTLARDAGMVVREAGHFAFIPNAVGRCLVHVFRPVDSVLNLIPVMRRYAMRVVMVLEPA